jgi:hypothetical protein
MFESSIEGDRYPAMVNVERTVEFADLKKQTEYFWWAAANLRAGPHSGAFWVLRVLQKSGKSEYLRYRAARVLDDLGYAHHAVTADW